MDIKNKDDIYSLQYKLWFSFLQQFHIVINKSFL